MAAYRRAVAVDPFFFAARSGIADILINSGQLNSAIDEYRQAMKAGHRNEQTMLALARTLVLRNLRVNPADRDWNEVEQVLNQAAILSPSSSQGASAACGSAGGPRPDGRGRAAADGTAAVGPRSHRILDLAGRAGGTPREVGAG